METENEATLQELKEKSTVSLKKNGKIFVGNWEKGKKKTKKFSKPTRVEEPEASAESEQAKPGQFKWGQFIWRETDQISLKILVYLDNSHEGAIAENSQIKEQHETVKLIIEEATMLQQKHIKP